MAKISLSEALARPSTVNEEILDATTEEDIRRHQAEDGYADVVVPYMARRVMPPRDLRVRLGLTQQEMADSLRIPVATWRNWETGRVRLDPAVRSLLDIVAANPDVAFKALGTGEESLKPPPRSARDISGADLMVPAKQVTEALGMYGPQVIGGTLIISPSPAEPATADWPFGEPVRHD